MFELVLGGFKSGKSRFALSLFGQEQGAIIVSGKGLDFEFKKRILRHRQERGQNWTTVETDADLGATLQDTSQYFSSLLVEGLDFWFFSLDKSKDKHIDNFWQSLKQIKGHVVLVSSELSLGLVPPGIDSQLIREFAGFNQKLANLCQRVYLVVAGCALTVKQEK